MTSLTLEQLRTSTRGQVLSQHHEIFDGVGTDTRTSLKNQIFFALKGESFDAHNFLVQAVQQGATVLVIHEEPSSLKELLARVTVVKVADTLKALQDFATSVRRSHKAFVIGIGGSNGKTTSKEFTAAVLSAVKKVHFSKGSFNNHWGVPFTLLAQPDEAEVAVVEMGMNHKGELARLCEIAEPDMVVLTTVGIEHIEHFGSEEAIADAEEEIFRAAPRLATRVYNLDNPYIKKMHEGAREKFPQARRLTFSEKETTADVFFHLHQVTMKSLTVKGAIAGVQGSATVPVFGAHNVTNLLVAAASALAAGMSPREIWSALPRCHTTWGRNQLIATASGAQILFDAYNANPDSMQALIRNMNLIAVSGQKIGVLGQMLELGGLSANYHRQLGEWVGRAGFDIVWFAGADAPAFEVGIKSTGFSKKLYITNAYEDSLASEVASMLRQNDMVLVKGSRGMKLERFVIATHPIDFSLNKG